MELPKMGGKKEKEKKNCGNYVAENGGGKKKMLRPQHFSQQITCG